MSMGSCWLNTGQHNKIKCFTSYVPTLPPSSRCKFRFKKCCRNDFPRVLKQKTWLAAGWVSRKPYYGYITLKNRKNTHITLLLHQRWFAFFPHNHFFTVTFLGLRFCFLSLRQGDKWVRVHSGYRHKSNYLGSAIQSGLPFFFSLSLFRFSLSVRSNPRLLLGFLAFSSPPPLPCLFHKEIYYIRIIRRVPDMRQQHGARMC